MSRGIKEIEAEMRDLLDEYYRACLESKSISFQGAVSDMAWDIEHEIEDITEDVC